MNKSHNEFIEDVKHAAALPAQTCRALGPESQEDIAMYANEQKLKETESYSAGDVLCEDDVSNVKGVSQ